MKECNPERLHPAVWPAALLILISVGRLPELLPFLGPLEVGKVAVIWAAAAIAMGPRDVGNPRIFDQRMAKLIVVWFVFATVSVVWSVWRSYSLGFLFGGLLSNMILFFVIARTTANTRTLRFYVAVLLLAAGLLSVSAVFAAATSDDMRISVTANYDPNDLAMVLVTLLPLAVVLLFAIKGFGRAVMLLLCGSILVGILLTGSRGGFLGLVAVGGYLFFTRLPRADGGVGPRFSPGKLAAATLGVIVLLIATPATVWDRLATIGALSQDYNVTASTGRLAIWERGLEAMAARPWGHGLKTFEAVEGERGGLYKAAHNIWIEIGVELGVQGLVLMTLVLATAFGIARQVRLQPPRAPPYHWPLVVALGLRGALLGYLVTGFFLSAAYAGVLFAVLGMFAGLQNLVLASSALAETPSEDEEGLPSTAGGKDGSRQPRPQAPVGGWRPIAGGRARGSATVRRSRVHRER